MDATQAISDSIFELEEEETEEESPNERGKPLARLCILKNPHIPEKELSLFLGDNILGRDPNICTLQLLAPSVSKQHATISISVYRRRGSAGEVDMEALVWDRGSMNGTRKGRLKLTPNVRYALSEGETLVLGDIPCRFVSARVDYTSSVDNPGTPLYHCTKANARLSDSSDDKWDGVDTRSKTCIGSGRKANWTPVTGGCLSFEQTPVQPQGTLVPESDSDSDSQRGRRAERKQKTIMSDSDSHKSTPSSSAFLSPVNKVVPESEGESPITPSSSRNGSNRRVGFSSERTDVDRGHPPSLVENGEVEEEGAAARGGTDSEESGMNLKMEISTSLAENRELLGSTFEVCRGGVPEFNLDSDTDVEGGDEEVVRAGQAGQPPSTCLPHMDSNTDVDDDISEKVPETLPPADETTKPAPVASGVQLEAFMMDSDTDVDDDISEIVPETLPPADETTKPAPVASGVQLEAFMMDSDTDVDDDISEIVPETLQPADETTKPAPVASGVQLEAFMMDSDTDVDDDDDDDANLISQAALFKAVHHVLSAPSGQCEYFHLNSDTDVDEEEEESVKPTPAAPHQAPLDSDTCNKPLGEPCLAAGLNISSRSDTDPEEDSPPAIAAAASGAPEPDSDGDTDVDEPLLPRAGDEGQPAEVRMESDTDVEEEEGQVPRLQRENTPVCLVPPLQMYSTPIQHLGGEVKQVETQAFASPTSDAFSSSLGPVVTSYSSDSQEDEDYAVAETQSFIHQTKAWNPNLASVHEPPSTRGESFQLGCEVWALNTQAYVPADGGASLEATQPYEEPCSEMSEKQGCVDLAFEATQAYIPEPYDEGSDEDKRQHPASSALATAETQPMLSSLEPNDPVCFSDPVEAGAQEEPVALSVAETQPMCTRDSGERDAEGFSPQTANERKHLSTFSAVCLAETQPMCLSDSQENDEGLSAASLPAASAETRPIISSPSSPRDTKLLHLSTGKSRPTDPYEDDANNAHDSEILVPRKRKARQLRIDEEDSQQRSNSAEDQPLNPSEVDDDSDSMPRLRKRKAKPLQLEDETQSLVGSQVSGSHPSGTCEEEQSSRDFFSTRKRKAKIEDEQTQPLLSCDNIAAGEDGSAQEEARNGNSDGEESMTCPRKSKEKRLHQEEEEMKPATKDRSVMKRNVDGNQEEVTGDHQRTRGRRNASKQEETEEGKQKTTENESLIKEQEDEKPREDQEQREHVQTERHNEREELIREGKEEMQPIVSEVSSTSNLKETEAGSFPDSKHALLGGGEEEEEEARRSPLQNRPTQMENKSSPTIIGRRGKIRSEEDVNQGEVKASSQRRRGRKSTRRRVDKEEETTEPADGKLREDDNGGDGGDTEGHQMEDVIEEEKAEDRQDIKPGGEVKHQEVTSLEKTKTGKNKEVPKSTTRAKKTAESKRRQPKESPEHEEEEENPKSPAKGRRAARRTAPEDSNDDFPARRTRSRSNSSNSVSSERSAFNGNNRETRGRGANRSSETPQTSAVRGGRRRTTAANTEPDAGGGRGRGRKTLAQPVTREREQRARRSATELLQPDNQRKAEALLSSTSRGQRRVLDKEGLKLNQGKDSADIKSPLPKKRMRGKDPKVTDGEHVQQAGSEVDGEQTPAEAGRRDEQKEETTAGIQSRRTSRASNTQVKRHEESLPKNEAESGRKMAVGAAGRKARGRTTAAQRNKSQELQETSGSNLDQAGNEQEPEHPQIQTMTPSLRRRVSSHSSPVTKTPRSSSGSPVTVGRLQAGGRGYKVLFTGVVDESGQRVLARLGGALASGVSDMNCLVTDKVRRTVKFLCAVAKGVPVVTTQWLEKSGKAGSFLSPHDFIVKDPEQEKKFSFSLHESLRAASTQPLLQGYEIHVTKSVKPEPVHMKDIIACSGASFLRNMPTAHKNNRTVVISCEEDLRLCGPAVSASLPVVTAEFILTGILQQRADFQTHALSTSAIGLQPTEGRGRGRRKTSAHNV